MEKDVCGILDQIDGYAITEPWTNNVETILAINSSLEKLQDEIETTYAYENCSREERVFINRSLEQLQINFHVMCERQDFSLDIKVKFEESTQIITDFLRLKLGLDCDI